MSLRDFFGFADPPVAKMDVDAASAQYLNSYAAANAYLGAQQEPPPKPRLAVVRRAPSRDAFAAWRDNPVTQFVFAALNHNVDECRDQWMSLSWGSGKADQRQLDGLRERADALLGFTADYDAFCETLGLAPEASDA